MDITNPVEELPVDCHFAVGTGYSESKWVSEKILSNAAAATSLRPIIVRVGQISGSVNGHWNEKEWFPSLIRSSIYLKCLPMLDQVSSIPHLEQELLTRTFYIHVQLDCHMDSSECRCESSDRDALLPSLVSPLSVS